MIRIAWHSGTHSEDEDFKAVKDNRYLLLGGQLRCKANITYDDKRAKLNLFNLME